MGKQVKGWTPPEDDEVVVDSTVDQEKPKQQPVQSWTPPSTDEVVEEPVKKKELSGSDSQPPAEKPGKPSGENIIKTTPKQQEAFKEAAKNLNKTPAQIEQDKRESIFEEQQKIATDQFLRGKKKENVDPITAFLKTIESGVSDQIPKEYYVQRLRMSKGEFGDLFDPRSDLNAFGDKLPPEISRSEFSKWVNKQPGVIRTASYNDKARFFIEDKLGADGYERLKKSFEEQNVKERTGFVGEIVQQEREAAQKTEGVVQDLSQVESASDFLNFIGNSLGQSMYRAPLSIGTGGVTSYVTESAAVYDRQLQLLSEKYNISKKEVVERGLDEPAAGQAMAVLAGALDTVSQLNLVNGFFRGAAAGTLTKSSVNKFMRGFLQAGVPEAATEAAQGELEEFGATQGAKVDYSPDAWRIATGAAGGLFGSGLLGGTGAVVQNTSEVINNELKNPDVDSAAETIQDKVESDAGTYTFTKPVTDDQKAQNTPVAPGQQEGKFSEDQAKEALSVQNETASTPEVNIQKQEVSTGPESGIITFGKDETTQEESPAASTEESQSGTEQPSVDRPSEQEVTDQPERSVRNELSSGLQQDGSGQEIASSEPVSGRTLKIAERILASDANESIKKGIREKGAEYIPKKLAVTDKEANDLIDLYGPDKAESIVRDTKNEVTGDTRTALAARLYERYKDEGDRTTDQAEKDRLHNKAVDIALFGAEQAKEAGRAVNANKIWKAITADEDMTVLALEKENRKIAEKLTTDNQKDADQLKTSFEEQVRRAVEKRVQETVGDRVKRAKLITDDQKKKISDAFDALKVKDVGGTANDVIRVVGSAVWNGAMDAVKAAVLTGADVANAVQAGIDYIRDNYKGSDFNEEEFRGMVTPSLQDAIPQPKLKPENINPDDIKTKIKGSKKKQLIDELVEEYNKTGGISDDRFDEIYAKQLGYKPFTAEDRSNIRNISKIISEAEKFEQTVKDDFTRENIAKYQQLLDDARKANKKLQEYARKPSNVWDTLITIMQGNLLTPLSIVTNVYSNAALQPMRFMSTGIGSLVDQMVSKLAKLEIIDKSYKDPTIDMKALQKGYFGGIWDGAIEGFKQLKEGQLTSDKNLREINAGFDPVAAVKRWKDTDRNAAQKVNDAIEGTLGFPAEGMFRLLNFGDKPFRKAAEIARAMEIGEKKGLKGDDLMKFVMFPDEQSAQEIEQAGKEATFQQDTEVTKKVQSAINWVLDKVGEAKVIGGPAKLLLKSQIPFVKTPLNIVIETLDYALFPVTFTRGVTNIMQGNQRQGSVQIGKAVVGAIVMGVARELFQTGILSWEDPKDKKGKNIQYDTVPPSSINMSALRRGLAGDGFEIKDGDTWVNYKKMGVLGNLFNIYATNYKKAAQEDQQMPGIIEDMVTAAPRVLSSSLEQSFLKGTNSLLNAIQDSGGYDTQQWAVETAGAMGSILIPNTVATVSKSHDEYIRDTYDRNLGERLKATFIAKTPFSGNLPAKVNVWGEKVTGNPEGRNKYFYYLFDPTKFKNVDTEDYKWKLYESWKNDNFNNDWLPSMPNRNVKVKGIDMKLSPKEYERYLTYIGQERAKAVQSFVRSGWRGTNEAKIEKLRDIYSEAGSLGKKKFLMNEGWSSLTPKKLEAINKNR